MATRAKARARVIRSASSLAPAIACRGRRSATSAHPARCRTGSPARRRRSAARRRLSMQLQQIGGEAEGRDVSRGRQQLLEVRGLVAFQRRAGVLGLQALEVACPGEDIGDRQRDRRPRRARNSSVCWAIDISWSSGRTDATVFASSTSRVLRTEPVETVETKRRPVPASGVEDWPEESSSTTTRVIIDCAVARCFSMSASGMVVRPVSIALRSHIRNHLSPSTGCGPCSRGRSSAPRRRRRAPGRPRAGSARASRSSTRPGARLRGRRC